MGESWDSNVRRFLDGCIVCLYLFHNCDDIPCDENAGLNTKDARGGGDVCVSGLGGQRVSCVWTPS